MLAFCGIILLCWAILHIANLIGEITGYGFRSAMIALAGFGICAILIIGFFVTHL
jgi:hypothetical protein